MADQKHSWSHLHVRLASQVLGPVTQLKQRFVSLCVADIESLIFFFRFTWIIGKPSCKLPCHVWPGPWMTLFSLLFSQLLPTRPYCAHGVSLLECSGPLGSHSSWCFMKCPLTLLMVATCSYPDCLGWDRTWGLLCLSSVWKCLDVLGTTECWQIHLMKHRRVTEKV